MNKNCTNLVMAAAATTVLAFGGIVHADQAAMSAPGRAMPTPGHTPIGGQPLIWDNGGPNGDNGLSHFEGVLDGVAFNREVADDFETGDSGSSGWQLTGVQMSGVWFAGASAPGPLSNLRVRIWDDAAGEPGNVVYDATVGFTAQNTGGVYFTRPEVSYTADVNAVLDNNTTYWISIQPVGTTDNFFHLTSGTEGGAAGSCVGNCGGQADGCWCDETCCGAGDCCPDKFKVCGGCEPINAGLGGLLGMECMLRGDFDPPLVNWTPGSVVFGDSHDVTFKIYGVPAASNCPADLNGDNVVNVSDLLILLGAWGACPGCDADLNDDGVVNVSDMLVLLGAWGNCPAPPAPTGACCFADFTCMEDMEAADCAKAGGNYNGNFSTCGSCPQPPSGETCGDALAIDIDGPAVGANSTGNPTASFPACGSSGSPNSGTVWYTVVGNGTTLTASTCGSGVSASMAIFCGECNSLICNAGAADGDCPGNPFTAEASWCAADGETYLIAVWGNGAEGDIELAVTSGSACTPTIDCEPPVEDSCEGFCGGQTPDGCWCDEACCAKGDCCEDKFEVCGGCDPTPAECDPVNCSGTPEGEPCGDDINGGCNSDPAVFGSIAFGETVCGNAWATGGTRDTDWYLFTVTEDTTISWAVEAEEEIAAIIVGGVDGCANPAVIDSAVGCNVTVTVCLTPGNYVAFVGPAVFEGFPCPGFDYSATLTGTSGACNGGGGDPPANDECGDAIDITANINGAPVTGDNTNANATGLPTGSPSCHWNGTPADTNNVVWFEFTAPGSSVTISSCNSQGTLVDTVMAVYQGNCGSLVEVACGEDECGAPTYFSTINATGLTAGNTYKVMLANPGFGNPGTFSFTISTP